VDEQNKILPSRKEIAGQGTLRKVTW
jgi:hypothetical protein